MIVLHIHYILIFFIEKITSVKEAENIVPTAIRIDFQDVSGLMIILKDLND